MSVDVTLNIQMQFSGDAGSWTDITNDVRVDEGLRVRYGLAGSSPLDRVAITGTFSFALDNSTSNSAGVEGYYSPGGPRCRPGFDYSIGVRLALTYSGTTYYKFRGRLDSIQPEPGVKLGRHVWCEAVDWMDEAFRRSLRDVAVQVDQVSDDVFSAVLAAMPVQPAATDIQAGIFTFPYALDNSQNERAKAAQEFDRIARSEYGLIYVRGDTTQGGTLVFENAHARSSTTTNAITLTDASLTELEALRDRDDLLNLVQVQVRPRTADTSLSTVFDMPSEPTIGSNGGTLTLNCPYRDPNENGQRIGAYDVVTPVATTDWTVISQTDGVSDLTAFCTVAAVGDLDGNAGVLLVTNNHPTHEGRITSFKIRGKALTSFAAEGIWLTAEDTASQDERGENGLTLEMTYQSDPNVGQGLANLILNRHSTEQTNGRVVGFVANTSSTLMTAALAREISDRVGVQETLTGLNAHAEWKDQYQEDDLGSFDVLRFSSSKQRAAQGFKCNPGVIGAIEWKLQRIGFPTGNIWCEIQSDSSGSPSGTALATSNTIKSADIQIDEMWWTRFTFPSPLTVVSSSTQYHLVLYSDTAISASNYFQFATAGGDAAYLNGTGKNYNGSAWSSSGVDFDFRLWLYDDNTATTGYFINAIELEMIARSHLVCRWTLAPADRQSYWKLGTSALGLNTTLAYI